MTSVAPTRTATPGILDFPAIAAAASGNRTINGSKAQFEIGADLKAKVEGIENEDILKAVNSQLWEVAIHRVRRSFEQTHGENTFTAGDTNDVGTEVLVGGKGAG